MPDELSGSNIEHFESIPVRPSNNTHVWKVESQHPDFNLHRFFGGNHFSLFNIPKKDSVSRTDHEARAFSLKGKKSKKELQPMPMGYTSICVIS